MKYIAKDEVKNIVTKSKEFLQEGITFADVMPAINKIVMFTNELLKQYTDPYVFRPILTAIAHKEIDQASSCEAAVALHKLVKGNQEYIASIDSPLFKDKIAENSPNAESLMVNYIRSISIIADQHLTEIWLRGKKEIEKQWRKESPHLFKLHDDRMKMYRERYNELVKKKQDEEAKQNQVEAKEEKEPVKSLTM